MRPLPPDYRTSSPDGKTITVYHASEKIGEVTAPKDATQEQLVALEDEAADIADAHAAKAAAKAPKPARRPAAKKKKSAKKRK